MKKTISLVLVLALGLAAEVAKADFTFGEPTNLGSVVNSSAYDGLLSISADDLELYFGSTRPGGLGELDLWVTTRESVFEPWGPPENLGLPVNSPQSDLWPNIYADGLELYIYSHRSGGYGSGDIWLTTRTTTEDPWGEPVNLGPSINSREDDGAAFPSADGLELYFTSRRSGNYNLYVSKRSDKNDKWSEPVSLDILNSPDSESGASLTADGLTLFFHSDRPGGFGGYDLYVATRETRDVNWSPPVNLGPAINTQYGDMCARLSFDGHTLYFCEYPLSDVRPGGMGGGDLWQVLVKPVVDLNDDGIVDPCDVYFLVDHWGTDEPLCDIGPTPFGDGIVDVQDLIALAEHLFEDYRLIGHWKLDETEGDIAYDSAGNNHGTLNGDPQWVSGIIDGALEFDGDGDYVDVGSVGISGNVPKTVAGWAKASTTDIPSWTSVFGFAHNGSGNTTYHDIEVDDTGHYVTHICGYYTPIIAIDAEWHHLVFTWDGIAASGYVDGQLIYSVDAGGAILNTVDEVRIGARLSYSNYFPGIIDDVRIYNVALTAEEIAALAQ